MTVDAITGGTSPTSALTGSASMATAGSALASVTNGDTFLKLLVAQLKYQDPMNPTDGTQFLSQTAQMSEAANMASVMQSEQSLASEIGTLTSTSMIGAQVTATQADGSKVTGLVSSVSVDPTGPVLHLSGGASVPLSAVTEVDRGATATGGTTTTSSTTSTSTSTSTGGTTTTTA